MSKRSDKDYLSDIQEAIIKVQQYVEGYDLERFLEDPKTQDAVVRNLEVIGEASKNVSIPLKMYYLDVPWKDLAGVRDRLVHHYWYNMKLCGRLSLRNCLKCSRKLERF